MLLFHPIQSARKLASYFGWVACFCCLAFALTFLPIRQAMAAGVRNDILNDKNRGPVAHASGPVEFLKLTAVNSQQGDYFGHSTATDGNTIVVGARYADVAGVDAGAVYIFERGQNWQQTAVITGSDTAAGDQFGTNVLLISDTLVVGAQRHNGVSAESGAAYVFYRHQGGPNQWGQVAKLTASDAAAADRFGLNFALSGDTLVVGAHWDDDYGEKSGSAYVFERNFGGLHNWGETAKLTTADSNASDRFGMEVAIHNDTILVGAPYNDENGSFSGSVYVFQKQAGTWQEIDEFAPADGAPNSYFGNAIETDGSYVLVGANDDDAWGSSAGAAYIFEYGGSWQEVTRLTPANTADTGRFGWDVLLEGDLAIVGAVRDSSIVTDSGSAYIFQRDQGGVNNWGQVALFAGTDTDVGDGFGGSLAIKSGLLVVGAGADDDACPANPDCDSGSVYVFDLTPQLNLRKRVTPTAALPGAPITYTLTFSNSGDITITQAVITDLLPLAITQVAYTSTLPLVITGPHSPMRQLPATGTSATGRVPHAAAAPVKITAFDADREDYFGDSVASNSDILVVGAARDDDAAYDAGAVYIYARQCDSSWELAKKLTASDATATSGFGRALFMDQDILIVGAPTADGPANESGAAYIFMRHHGGTNNWGEVAKLVAPDGRSRDRFGWSVAVYGDTVVAGARWHDNGGFNRGAAYVFQQNHGGPNKWGMVAKLTASDATDQDLFGVAVGISQDTVVVGAQGPDATSRPGKAYIFERSPANPMIWNETKILTASDGAARDHFGNAVAIDHDTIVVGAITDDTTSNDTGSAYIFERDQGGSNNWGELTKLTASDAQSEDRFGRKVAIDGDVVFISAYYGDGQSVNSGAAYVFLRDQDGSNSWGETQKLVAPDGRTNDYFGAGLPGIAINQGSLVVGAYGDDDACPSDPNCNSGSVYVFDSTPAFSITETVPLVWQLPALAPGAGGIITITGIVRPELNADSIVTNTAVFATHAVTPTVVSDTARLTITVPRLLLAQQLAPFPESIGTAAVTVTLSVSNPYADVTVCYETLPGTASPNVDYLADTSILTVTAATTQGIIPITIVDDTLAEGEETLFVRLSNPLGAQLLPPITTTLRIADDDPLQLGLRKTVAPGSAQPGQAITYTLLFTNESGIALSQARITDVLPALITQAGYASTIPITPTGGLHYAWQLPPLAPGVGGIITVTGIISPGLITDEIITNIASFATDFVAPTLVTDTAVLTITVPRIHLVQHPISVPEAAVTVPVTVTLDTPNPYADVTVSYETLPGTAMPGVDYVAVAGSLTFPAGTTQAAVAVPILDDMQAEADETLSVRLFDPLGAQLRPPVTATILIVDDDPLQLALQKSVTPVVAAPDQEITYTLAFTNLGALTLPQATITDVLPTLITQPAFTSTLPITQTGSLPYAWQLGPLAPGAGGIITITGIISPDLTANTAITNTAVFATTFITPTTTSDTAVLHVVVPASGFHAFLPLITQKVGAPTFPLHAGDAIPARPVAFTGEVFYTATLQIPSVLPQNGRFFFSASPNSLMPVVVDDELVLTWNNVVLYRHEFASASQPPIAATLEISRPLMILIAGETVTITYQDVYGNLVGASPVWIVLVQDLGLP